MRIYRVYIEVGIAVRVAVSKERTLQRWQFGGTGARWALVAKLRVVVVVVVYGCVCPGVWPKGFLEEGLFCADLKENNRILMRGLFNNLNLWIIQCSVFIFDRVWYFTKLFIIVKRRFYESSFFYKFHFIFSILLYIVYLFIFRCLFWFMFPQCKCNNCLCVMY